MRKQTLIFLTLVSLLGTVNCASYFKRKDCEKTNWYQHGYDVAMSGQRLDADDFTKQCQKVEARMSFSELDTGFKAGMAKYCLGDNIYNVGRAGKPFSYDMCDGENLAKMKGRYNEGLRVFCTPSNGYRFGTSGGVYLNVCPRNSENEWLVEYRKGRKIYLNNLIAEKEREVQRLDSEISRFESQRASLNAEQTMVSGQTEWRTETVVNPDGSHTQRTERVLSPSAQVRSQQLSSDISSLNYQIQGARSKQKALNEELSKMRAEVVTL